MIKDKRSYNVFLNVHTVSGIVITIGLFVIFLAGAFALFRTEIDNWQYNEPDRPYKTVIDYDRVLEVIQRQGYETKGRDFSVHYFKKGDYINVRAPKITGKSDSTLIKNHGIGTGNRERISMRLDPGSYTLLEQPSAGEKFLGNYIYRLHFFHQIPVVGRYLSGFVALFFGLAVISGIIVHWKKVIPNFFTFRIKSSIKNLWTDAHVALGVLGLPFQFMYAITGAYLGVVLFLNLPILFIQYGGDAQKFEKTVYPDLAMEAFPAPTQQVDAISINELIDPDLGKLDPRQVKVITVNISNYQEKQAILTLNINYTAETQFMTAASKVIRLADGLVLQDKSRDDYNYAEATGATIIKLHYATFGGFFVKITYFILSIITCYVILSGVMIWLVAREKKTYAHKAKFNRNVGAIFIGACMGLYPAIALFFCLVKLFPEGFDTMSTVFFLFWLAYTIYALVIKSPFKINKHALILAGGLGLFIPVINGIQSGLWFWKSLGMGYSDSFFVDVGWLLMGSFSLVGAFLAKPLDTKKLKGKPQEKTILQLEKAK